MTTDYVQWWKKDSSIADYFDEWHTLGNWIESMQKALQDSLTLLPTSNDEQQEKYVKHEVKTQIPSSTEWGNL